MLWHREIDLDQNKVIPCVEYFNKELEEGKTEAVISGSVTKALRDLPYLYERRFGQLQELESVLEVMEAKQKKLKSDLFNKYTTNMQRLLTSTDAMKYVEGDQQYVDYAILIAEVAYVRNRYLGVIKAIEHKSWSLNMISKLRVAGIEDASV